MTKFADLVDNTAGLLRAAAESSGFVISGDGRVSEQDAATLLGYSLGHVRRLREENKGPVSYSRGMNGNRQSYRLEDLAIWIENGRDPYA